MSKEPFLFKEEVYLRCIAIVEEKLNLINTAFAESREALSSEAKSTAGDKHETGRAMIQLEQEKMGRQLLENQKLLNILQRIDSSKSCKKIQSGALFLMKDKWYFIAVGLGGIELNDKPVFVMAPTSPLAQAMLGKMSGESLSFNGKSFTIKDII